MNDYENIKDYGFVAPEIKPEEWVLGAVDDWEIVNPSGTYLDVVPPGEDQKKAFDTYTCTCFGKTSSVEGFLKKIYNITVNFSDRCLAIFAGVKPPGANPHDVYEAARKSGLVKEELLPFDVDTIEEYTSFPNKSKEAECIYQGQEWLRWWELNHKWVWSGQPSPEQKQTLLKEALKRGAVGVAVRAWKKADGVYVKNPGEPDTHWVALMGYNSKDQPVVLDSYPDDEVYLKTLQKNYDFGYAKVAKLKKRETPLSNPDWLTSLKLHLIELLKALVGVLTKAKEAEPAKPTTLLDIAKSYIGQDASPKNLAPQELSCAEGVSNIIHQYDGRFPKDILATDILKKTLDDSPLFKRTLIPKPNCVIVSPRTLVTNGHAGFFAEDQKIISNSSKTGKMEQNYTLDTWVQEFRHKRGLAIYFWEPVDKPSA